MRRLRFLSDLWHNFLSGDRAWAALRLVVVLLVLLAFIVYERFVFGSTDYRVVAEAWLAHYPFLAVLPEKLLWFVASIFTLHNLRYYVMPVAALLGALLIAANYVREIHELPHFWLLRHRLDVWHRLSDRNRREWQNQTQAAGNQFTGCNWWAGLSERQARQCGTARAYIRTI